jgi:hypothetical protein
MLSPAGIAMIITEDIRAHNGIIFEEDIPDEESEFDRLIGFFINRNAELAHMLGYDSMEMDDKGLIGIKKEPDTRWVGKYKIKKTRIQSRELQAISKRLRDELGREEAIQAAAEIPAMKEPSPQATRPSSF